MHMIALYTYTYIEIGKHYYMEHNRIKIMRVWDNCES